MDPSEKIITQLRVERHADAQKLTFEQRFLAGAELFDYSCEIAKAGIRMQNPGFDESRVMEELRRRMEIGERLGKSQ